MYFFVKYGICWAWCASLIHTADTYYFFQSNTTNVSVSSPILFSVYSDIVCSLVDSFHVTSTESENCNHYKSTSEKNIL